MLDVLCEFDKDIIAAQTFDGILIDAPVPMAGLGCEVVSMEDGMVADAHQEQRGGTSLATERILVKLPQVKKPKWLPVACPVCGPAFPIRLGADCMPVTSDPGRPTNAARAASPLLTAGEVQAHQEAGLAQRVSYVGEQ